jgi:hypothetical protein
MSISTAMAKALSTFHEKCPPIELDGKVAFKGVEFKYATLHNIIETTKEALRESGLVFFHSIEPQTSEVKCTLVCLEDGTTITSSIPSNFTGLPQNIGSQITYFKRYTLQSVLGIVAEEDNDASQVEVKKVPMTEELMRLAKTKIANNEKGILGKLISTCDITEEQLTELYEFKFINEGKIIE